MEWDSPSWFQAAMGSPGEMTLHWILESSYLQLHVEDMPTTLDPNTKAKSINCMAKSFMGIINVTDLYFGCA